ncbi:UNVERIFIED_CONTAM: hypothetical protein GTU68_051616 [Idotea baltica]|nr:hypothetical protein [Idotea baltica]
MKSILFLDIFQESLKHPDFFNVANLFTTEDLFNAKIHLGHKEGSLCSYMKPYIFGSRLGHLVLDLDQTSVLLRDALNFTSHIAFRGGIILFICRGAQHQILVEGAAKECQEFSHTREWHLGTLTNSTKYFGCITRLPDLIIFLNTMNDVLQPHVAVKDAARMLIPSVGIVDTNCDPRLIAYPVPGNDDSRSAISFYCRIFKEAILNAKKKRNQVLNKS